MKKIFIVQSLLLIILLFSAASCASFSELTDEDARAILSDLIPKSEELNEIYWGKGLPASEDSEGFDTMQYYVEVSPDSKYQTIAQLVTATEAVFSEEFCKLIFELGFYGSDDISPRYGESENGVLQVNVSDKGYTLQTKLFPENAVIVRGFGDEVIVKVPATFGGEPYEDIELHLVKENGVWLLNSPTY